MERRQLLKSALSAATIAASGATATASDAQQARGRASVARRQVGSYVETRDGQHLFFTDWGEGRPIVFLGAWGLPSEMWEYQMVPLSERFRCVAFDRRGHGRSTRPGSGFDYDTLADDVAAVLEALDLRNVTLVGMSMAGGELVRYMTRHGGRRIARLIFVATAATPFLTRTADNPAGIPAERFEAFRRSLLLRDYPKWLEDNRPPFFTANTSRELQEWMRMLMLRTSLKALVECHRSQTSTDFRAELPKISVPALVVHGDTDVSAPIDLTGRPTAAMIPGAQLKVYDGGPHGLFLTHMERLTSDIQEFTSA
jgi:non-heme chloroperoxidase